MADFDDGLDDYQDFEDEEEGGEGDQGGGGDRDQFANLIKPAMMSFLIDGCQLMLDLHQFSDDERAGHVNSGIKHPVKTMYGLAMSTISNFCRDMVKKGYKDKVGIILYNVESGDGSVQDGFQELVAMGDLNCKKIQLMQEHAKSGTYVEAGKTNSTKPCKRMFHESNSGSCHLTNAVRAAQQSITASGEKKDGRKTIVVLTCCDDPIGGKVRERGRRERKAGLLTRCKDIKGFSISLDVYPLVAEVGMDGFDDLVEEGRPSRTSFRAGIVFKNVLTLSLASDPSPLADKCASGDDEFGELDKDVREDVERRLMGRFLSDLHADLEGQNTMRSLGTMSWVIESGFEVAIKVYSMTTTAALKRTMVVHSKTYKQLESRSTRVDIQTGEAIDNQEWRQHGRQVVLGPKTDSANEVLLVGKEMDAKQTLGIPKGFRLIGFRPRNTVLPELNLGPSYIMVPDDKTISGSAVLFTSLWQEMHKMEMVAICAVKMRAASEPRRCALVPQKAIIADGMKMAPDCMHVVDLPFCDDIRQPPPNVTNYTVPPPKDAVEAARKVIRHQNVAITPLDYPSPVYSRYVATVEAVALGKPIDQDEIDESDKMLTEIAYEDEDYKRKHLAKLETLTAQWKRTVDVDFDEHMEESLSAGASKRARGAVEKSASTKLPARTDDGVWVFQDLAHIEFQSLPVLKTYLKEVGLPVSGKKGDVVERVRSSFFKN